MKNKSDITVKRISKPSDRLASSIEYLMDQLNPGSKRSNVRERFYELLQNPCFILFGAFNKKGNLLGIVTLYKVSTLGRKCVLFEECIVDSRFRGEGIGQSLVRAAIKFVESTPDLGDRIEGTVNENNTVAWNAYMRGGFHDRHNRAFFWVRHWK